MGKPVYEDMLSLLFTSTIKKQQDMSRKKETELQKLIRHINSIDRPFEFCDISKCNLFFNGTLRKTITYLYRAGFIERIERGRYKRLKTIPENMTTVELEKMAYK